MKEEILQLRAQLAAAQVDQGWKEKADLLTNVFSEDQIKCLENKRNVSKWSDETVGKALEVRYTCGTTGYEYLRSQLKMPLPSIRVLQQRK